MRTSRTLTILRVAGLVLALASVAALALGVRALVCGDMEGAVLCLSWGVATSYVGAELADHARRMRDRIADEIIDEWLDGVREPGAAGREG